MNQTMAWMYLLIAGLLEIGGTLGLKNSHGFTKFLPSFLSITFFGFSLYLVGLATKVIPMGTAYAVWVGIGALGAAMVGIIFFKEPASIIRIFFLGLLLASIIGLKLSS